jgi:outer membrane lipoprotein-sorting protein
VRRTTPKGASPQLEHREPDLDKPDQFVGYFHFYWANRYRDLTNNIAANMIDTATIPVNGAPVECYVVQVDTVGYGDQKPGSQRSKLWVDRRNSKVWKEENAMWLQNGVQQRAHIEVTATLLDEPLPADTFVFKPPKGAKEAPLPRK